MQSNSINTNDTTTNNNYNVNNNNNTNNYNINKNNAIITPNKTKKWGKTYMLYP